MNNKNFRTIVILVSVISLMISGCSGISYAAAPTNTSQSPEQTPISAPQSIGTPAVQEPDGLSLTQDELVGTWFNGTYIVFLSNGTYRIYASEDALQAGYNLYDGQYGLQGSQLWLGPMSRYCNGMGFYQVAKKGESELEFTQIREECSRFLGKIQRIKP